MELQIDTATRYASVGLSHVGNSLVELAWRSERNHSIELVPAINRALEHAGSSINDLEAVFVASGPGGFSALRVGMSTAKALASTRSIPLVTVGTLDLELSPFVGLAESVCAIVSAGRTRVYVGNRTPGSDETNVDLLNTDEFLSSLESGTLYCGEAAPDLRSEIVERLGQGALISDARPPTRRSSTLAYIGYTKLVDGDVADPTTVEPLYLRSSQVNAAARRWGVKR